MTKKLPLFLLFFFLLLFTVVPVQAQNQTGDTVPPVATNSGTATQSATSTTSATTATESSNTTHE